MALHPDFPGSAYDFVLLDLENFEKYKPTSFKRVVDSFREYK